MRRGRTQAANSEISDSIRRRMLKRAQLVDDADKTWQFFEKLKSISDERVQDYELPSRQIGGCAPKRSRAVEKHPQERLWFPACLITRSNVTLTA